MKKIVLSLAAVFAFGVASAQTVVEDVTIDGLVSSKGEYYLPQAGDWSIGFNASKALGYVGSIFSSGGVDGKDLLGATEGFQTPTTGVAPTSAVTAYSFVGKQFVTSNEAVRYTANLNVNFSKVGEGDATTNFGLMAGYGKEWRKGTTRLQGFYGADALVGFGSFAKENMGFKVGAQGFVGAEYFIFPKVALGAQYTYGFFVEYTKVGDVGTTKVNLGNSTTDANIGVGTASVLLNLYF